MLYLVLVYNIKNRSLILENLSLVEDEKQKSLDFYISKKNDVLSTLYPENKNDFYKVNVKCEKASSLIKKYLKKYNTNDIEYIKIDIEGSDKYVLKDLFENKIFPKNLSVECKDSEVINLILSSPYKSFKFVKGRDVKNLKNINIKTKDSQLKNLNFDIHSSGPYGEDILGDFFSKDSILPYFLNNGLGWKDIHCCLEETNYNQSIKYNRQVHRPSFRYHLKRLFPSFVIMLKSSFRYHLKRLFPSLVKMLKYCRSNLFKN